ncbi:GNAT family acetyltransferase [Amnibacterium sp. CER49]|uniref:GNAT family acetyltransferase n=1 Tax=Amnibacterium sp. CER49 TaxID=3039161 RepID=UPI00244CB679|nr:GNAT family acetyltransferase [Amnibacterium sp. CER49]MDH2443978.1 GNAT family acetyltransferase [Amnibacterium sp. CER49]
MSAVVRPFRPEETEQVVALWRACGLTRPWNDPRRDIERKLAVQPELFLVAEADGAVVGTAMAGYDGHRGWVYYVAVLPELQSRGVGTRLMAEVESRLLAMGCPKVNVQIRGGNEAVAAFYARLGFAPDSATGLGKRLVVDG